MIIRYRWGMGMSAGPTGSTRSDINVTPLIDVLLVLLIIFLVVMPVVIKMETVQVPRKIPEEMAPDPRAMMLVVKLLEGDQDIVFTENEQSTQIPASELLRTLRPRIEALASLGASEKVVFVDFADGVTWGSALATVDSIRSLAADVENHDEIRVAIRIHGD